MVSGISSRRRVHNGINDAYGKKSNNNVEITRSTPRKKDSKPRSFHLCLLASALTAICVLVSSRSNSYSQTNDFFRGVDEITGQSGLDMNAPVKKKETRDRYSPLTTVEISTVDAVAKGRGSKVPVLLKSGWEAPRDWTESEFSKKFGHFPQYVKNATVQPYRFLNNPNSDKQKDLCILPGSAILQLMKAKPNTKAALNEILFFTNNKENPKMMEILEKDYETPSIVKDIAAFQIMSIVPKGTGHSFHKHGESWLGQVKGRRQWWFLPPGSEFDRVNACKYLDGEEVPPDGAMTVVQEPGDVMWFPTNWYHSTCALDEWTIGVGAQKGHLIQQKFPSLSSLDTSMSKDEIKTTLRGCFRIDSDNDKEWTWFDGNLNAYYNQLEKDIKNRNPQVIGSYAVHRWMGPKKSTLEHYRILQKAVSDHYSRGVKKNNFRVLDGGCGLGAALMWFEQAEPAWELTGHTISEEQHRWITEKLPKHNFQVKLQSYNDLDKEYDVMYSIEALIHSPNVTETFIEWSKHLSSNNGGGIVAIIDDFLAENLDMDENDEKEVDTFAKSWLANSLVSPKQLSQIAESIGWELVENRDLGEEYEVNSRNYRNKMPDLSPDGTKTHQGWMGSKWRQRLMLRNILTYNLLVFRKKTTEILDGMYENRQLTDVPEADLDGTFETVGNCLSIQSIPTGKEPREFTEITPQLMSGIGKNGGQKMDCISGWYCCNKGLEWFDSIEKNRNVRKESYLQLPRELFEHHYVDIFARRLNQFYREMDVDSKGRFLDIGGTGSTASGMKQVTSKFQHFAGPLEYWILDSDIGAKSLNERTLHCDIDNCPESGDCLFDVTFSHTVLEHAKRPWKTFDTIARITKPGGLTLHLVPFSYQYHATPEDHWRFSHTAVQTLLEDRNFTVWDVGYDLCTKPPHVLENKIDEHYDIIWLTYVIAQKNI